MSSISQRNKQLDTNENPRAAYADFSFDEENLPDSLYFQIPEEEIFQVLETGTVAWQPVGDFIQGVGLTLPKLLTGTFQELRDIFFKNFMSNPKSNEIIALQDQWRMDIVEEFQKPNAGAFENTIQAMVRTNEERWNTLNSLRLLRLFEKNYLRKGGVSIKFSPKGVETDLFTKMIPVSYQEEVPYFLQEKIFMRGMFGPKLTPIEYLYRDLFSVRTPEKSFLKEHLLFASSKFGEPLRMKLPDRSLQTIETSDLNLFQRIEGFLEGDSLYSSGKVLHTSVNKKP